MVTLCLGALLSGCSGNQAKADSSHAAKSAPATKAAPAAPVTPVIDAQYPGVDLGKLADDEKASFARLMQKYPSACGKPHSLAVSLRTDPSCKRSVYAARYLATLLGEHFLQSETEEQYDLRFSAPKVELNVKGAPVRGDAKAKVSIVEFSDFQCPHCKHLQPILETVLKDYAGQVNLVFKCFPLTTIHPDARAAAAAAIAAGKQGQVWGFHDNLFGGDQEHDSPSDLAKIASDLKLDVAKWKSDLPAAEAEVDQDRVQGEKLEIGATPTVYIDGRKYQGPLDVDSFKDWVGEALAK